MPPKQISGKGRTLAEPSFAQTTLQAFTNKENRSVVTAVGMFAVSYPSQIWMDREERSSTHVDMETNVRARESDRLWSAALGKIVANGFYVDWRRISA
jgi:hypothetical protein